MPTLPYFNAKGDRLPGVTWVLGQNLGWNKDALMRWANREGLAGRDIRGERTTAKRAADVGTVIHTMIEAHAQGWDPVAAAGSSLTDLTEDDQAKVTCGFESFQKWARNNRMTVIATELHLIDEEYQTGGCLDGLLLEDEGTLALGDWKSSKGTYADHFIQVSTYTVFVERKLSLWFGSPVRLSGAHVLRVGKNHQSWNHHFWSRDILEHGWSVFTWARALHQMRYTIESYVR